MQVMKVARLGLARFGSIILACGLALSLAWVSSMTPAAWAGDVAEREVIGFSSDGGMFAFEEFGIQDGSGWPYSTIYVVDTRRNAWVEGTPIRVRIEDEKAALATARAEAMAKAGEALRRAAIQPGRKGTLLASNPVTEVSSDPMSVTVVPRVIVPPSDERINFEIRAFDLADAACEQYTGVVGLAARMRIGDGEPVTLHRDKRIPKSRACPTGYSISDVIAYEPGADQILLVLLVNVFSYGFEGPDRRFIAIPAWTTTGR